MHPTKTEHHDFKSGFVVIVGAPNSGKSTLLNRLLGEKISITSEKPQTTRNRILGVLHLEKAQCIFIDTPGIHKASNPLNTRIVDAALGALQDADIILLLADATGFDEEASLGLINILQSQKKPVVLALNKIDLVKKQHLLAMISRWNSLMDFKEIIPVSASTGDQVPELIKALEKLLPQGPPFFPEDSLTDVSERFIVGELIREKIFRLTGQEIPYSVAVTVDQFTENPDGSLVKIHATIHVEKESQKGIVIGKSGTKLKRIGEEARKSMEHLLNTKVFLKLFVRVQKNWSKDTKSLIKFGY
jgi:GTP-binding protein Era